MTIAISASGRFIWGGRESRFIIIISASENATIIKVRIDPGSTNLFTSVIILKGPFLHAIRVALKRYGFIPREMLSLCLPTPEDCLHNRIWENVALPNASSQVD
jgi:hypothetical protein